MRAIGYHFHQKIIRPCEGKGMVAAAAYIAGTLIWDEFNHKHQDYSNKKGVLAVEFLAPELAKYRNPAAAWNALLFLENRKNARHGREFEIAFPHQFDLKTCQTVTRSFIQQVLLSRGLVTQYAIHAPDPRGDQRNRHVHILFSERLCGPNGFAKTKDRHLVSKTFLKDSRRAWAELCAETLQVNHQQEAERWRHSHERLQVQRSLAIERQDSDYAERCNRQPTAHLGKTAMAIDRQGKSSFRKKLNDDIQVANLVCDFRISKKIITKPYLEGLWRFAHQAINHKAAPMSPYPRKKKRAKRGLEPR